MEKLFKDEAAVEKYFMAAANTQSVQKPTGINLLETNVTNVVACC